MDKIEKKGRWARRLEQTIWQILERQRREKGLPDLWRRPIVRFADGESPAFLRLRQAVLPDHFLPRQILPGAKIVISYFLPFSRQAVESNVGGRYASPLWVAAYQQSSRLLPVINEEICRAVRQAGFRAAIPQDTGYAGPGVYKSRWSQRHIAWIGGMGTFGLHNLLLTDSGCCGYFSSVVTDLDLLPDAMLAEERCLWRSQGACGQCLRQCVGGAWTPEGEFLREKCLDMCMETAGFYGPAESGQPADACGKCAAGLPCSLSVPAGRAAEERKETP